MSFSVSMCLSCAGIFLLTGMVLVVVKDQRMMTSPTYQAPVYIDITHHAAVLYSFAALVMAERLKYHPYSTMTQACMAGLPLFFFAVTIARYIQLGLVNTIENQFPERNFMTTWVCSHSSWDKLGVPRQSLLAFCKRRCLHHFDNGFPNLRWMATYTAKGFPLLLGHRTLRDITHTAGHGFQSLVNHKATAFHTEPHA